ncbi:MAG: YciI family protein [Cypionkella sp.]
MSLFAVHCRDAPASRERRELYLEAHLAHVADHIERYLVAGPLRDPAGATVGSLLIVEARDEHDARAFIAADPYHAADVWAEVHVDAFTAAAGRWVGGAAWRTGS